ncbi:MAG: flagellar biosynthetic protein FliO [bacterium]
MTGFAPLFRSWAGRVTRASVPVRVVGRTALGHTHAVFVLDVAGRQYLVGTGPQSTQLLDILPSVEDASSGIGRPASPPSGTSRRDAPASPVVAPPASPES